MTMADSPYVTRCGLPGIGHVPFGMHACHFYRDRDQLAAALVPYFVAGLRGNERCLWVTAPPLPAREAVRALRAAWGGADDAIQTGALQILDFGHWYTSAARVKELDVVELWLKEEERALAEGYNGLRIAGNMSFLEPGDWPAFMEHEQAVTARFNGRRIVALCSYARSQCNDRQMSEVMRTHLCAFEPSDADWQVAAVSQFPGLLKQDELMESKADSQEGVSRDGGVAATRQRVPAVFEPGPSHVGGVCRQGEDEMNDSASSELLPELHCPDCRKPMRVRTLVPMLNGLWDLSFECDQCGKVSGVVHKPEDRQAG